ncbi:MAG: vanadium-dependent haloperoxidase [Acidimicrobiia bacterium]|nr:vanadium-dependent haloperoxidase [Acidimicrobiia bacterium]MDH4309224.1 vanadium-dependent haloperoxidase [Acidimicrobiia bacterium]
MAGVSRRQFITRISGAGLGAMLGLGGGAPASATPVTAPAATASSPAAQLRRIRAYQVREKAARYWRSSRLASHPTNGDDSRYADRLASFTKTLPHDDDGMVDLAAYDVMLAAASAGTMAAWETVPRGGTGKLVSPLGAYSYVLEGADPHNLTMAAPPRFDSADQAAELVELYWAALCRDVPFADYSTHPSTVAAVADLATFSLFSGITPGSLFRGTSPGELIGPYVSQFLFKDVPYGGTPIVQRGRWPVPGDDHMTTMEQCISLQRGGAPTTAQTLEATPRYIQTGRDLAEWVHRDYTTMGGQDAALILLSWGPDALSPTNPYRGKKAQAAFVNFGGPMVLDAVGRVGRAALQAAWYQKWLVHRRIRPEHFSARVETTRTGSAPCPIHPALAASEAYSRVVGEQGNALLSQAYPEGCPGHPSYPAGHAVLAGAFSTVLKAFFDVSFSVPSPVVPSTDGTALVSHAGSLTVGGELDKLAANIARGRDIAGVHWRSDGLEGVVLGEQVAIGVLRDLRQTVLEDFTGFEFTGYRGNHIVI